MPCPLHVHAACTLPPAAGTGPSSGTGTPAAPEKWRECPRCGMRWTTGKARARRRTVEKVTPTPTPNPNPNPYRGE
eukprot:scaffold82749_cov27-Phaeocystis_antarctica.AAC.1